MSDNKYVRVVKTLSGKGNIIPLADLANVVDDPETDWYYSPFIYSDDVLTYFEAHDHSIKGYTGNVYTQTLFWDLDCESDFERVRTSAVALFTLFSELGMSDGARVYFSGNKGVHLLLDTDTKFTPKEAKEVCKAMAREAGVPVDGPNKVFDSSVYNANRIFRIANTKHPKSGLYKIEIDPNELIDLGHSDIQKLAETPREAFPPTIEKAGAELKAKYTNKVELATVHQFRPTESGEVPPLDLTRVPKNKRKCIYIMEQGYIAPSERENCTIRMAAYYRSTGIDREQAISLINVALDRREQIYENVNPYSIDDTLRIVDVVYSEGWNGGSYTCRTDELLASKCSENSIPCSMQHQNQEENDLNLLSIKQLGQKYIKYAKESQAAFAKTGLEWLDKKIRIRPRNFSIIAGSNGSGKTSLVIQMMENFNSQHIYNVMFSLDMADSSLFEKLGARYTEYTTEQIEQGFIKGDSKIIEEVLTKVESHFPYTFFDFTSLTNSQYIEQVIRQVNLKLKPEGKKVEVGIIDYAGRLTGKEPTSYANATANALAANDIVKRQDLHMIYISQISREKGDHTDPLKTSRVSKDSGAWEENATFILNVWRPFGSGLENLDNYLHIYISKNRGGGLSERAFYWEGEKGNVREMDDDEYEKYETHCEEFGKPSPPHRPKKETVEQLLKRTKGVFNVSISTGKQSAHTNKPKLESKPKPVESVDPDIAEDTTVGNKKLSAGGKSGRFNSGAKPPF